MQLPILFINLDPRRDRCAFMQDQFAALGLAATRVAAVNAATLDPADTARYCNPDAVYCLSRSQLACWQSHTRAWQELLACGAPWGLVLEDDALLSARLPGFIEAFLSEGAADEVDLVQLETMARRTRLLPARLTVAGIALRRFRSTIWGTAAYLISAPTARRLLARADLFNHPADGVLFRPYVEPGRSLRVVLADPALAIQINKTENTGLALGNVAPHRPPARLGIRLARRWIEAGTFVRDAADHLRHLPQGMTAEVIPFESADRRYVGSKLGRYGVELTADASGRDTSP